MTVNENIKTNIETQDIVDTNLLQQKSDTNLSQKNEENVQEDPNWKAFREARKKDKSDKEAAEKRAAEKEAEATALKAAMEAAFSKQSAVISRNSGYIEDEVELTEDERIEKKVQAAITAREAASEKSRYERERNELPQRLIQAFPDYNQVVNEENGAYLEYHHPELYRSLLRQPENFETCSDIYKVVKKFVPNSTNAKKEAARAENNFNKPKSISSTGITQPGQATSNSRLTEEKRSQNWERMQRILKGVG